MPIRIIIGSILVALSLVDFIYVYKTRDLNPIIIVGGGFLFGFGLSLLV